jgi:hypothetical protein
MSARQVGADAAIAAGLALAGRLEQDPSLRLFGLAAAAQAAGRLTIAPDGCTYALAFRKGVVEHAASTDPADEVGRFLLRKGVLTPETLVQAEAARPQAGGDLVGALIALRLVAPGDAAQLLQEHGAGIVLRALAAEAGTFAWEPSVPVPAGAFPLGSPWAALCAAMRALDVPGAKRRLGEREERVVSRAAGRLRIEDLRLTPQESRAAAFLDGSGTPAEIAAAHPGDAATVLRLIVLLGALDLVAFGAVRKGAPPPSARAGANPTAGPGPAAVAPSPRPSPPLRGGEGGPGATANTTAAASTTAAANTTAAATATPSATPSATATATPSATPSATATATATATPTPTPTSTSTSTSTATPTATPTPTATSTSTSNTNTTATAKPTAKPTASSAASVPASAAAAPAARPPPPPVARSAVPVVKPAAPAAPPKPTPPPALEPAALRAQLEKLAGADHFQVLGVKKDAQPAQVKIAYFQLAKTYHPDAVPVGAPEEAKKLAADLFARISEAWGVLGDEARRAEYTKELESGGAANVDVMSIFAAENAFQQGTLLVKARKYDEARAKFEEALKLNAEEPEFGVWKAWCEFLLAADKKRAHAGAAGAVEAALRKNGRCLPAYLFLGQMAKIVGDLTLAEKHLKRGLAVEPENGDLVRELKYLRK